MNRELIFFVLSFLCSVFFSNGNKLSTVEEKIETLAEKYSSSLKQHETIFKDLEDWREKKFELDSESEKILYSISTKMQNVIFEGKQFIEKLQEETEKYNEILEEFQLKDLDKIVQSNMSDVDRCSSFQNKIESTNSMKVAGLAFDKFKNYMNTMVIIWQEKDNTEEKLQLIQNFNKNIIHSYHDTTNRKCEEMKRKIESKGSHSIYEEWKEMIANQNYLDLSTQRKIVEIERMLTEKAEQNVMTIISQTMNSNKVYNESVQTKLTKLNNDENDFSEDIQEMISEFNEPDTNYMILQILHSMGGEKVFHLIEKTNEYNNMAVKAKLLKILKQNKDNSGVSSALNDYFLPRELNKMINPKIYDLNEENKNYLTEASYYAIQAEKVNLILSQQWIRNTETETIEWMLMTLIKLNDEYMEKGIYVCSESKIFETLKNMISNPNPKQMYFFIAQTLQNMRSLDHKCSKKRDKLLEDIKVSFNNLMKREVQMLEDLYKTRKCDDNLLLQELQEMITEENDFNVNVKIIQLLNDVSAQIKGKKRSYKIMIVTDDYENAVKAYELRRKTASFINKEGFSRVKNAERRMNRIIAGYNNVPRTVPLKPDDDLFKHYETAMTDVISSELFRYIMENLKDIKKRSEIFVQKDEIIEKLEKLNERNMEAYNNNANFQLKYIIYLNRNIFRGTPPGNSVVMVLDDFIHCMDSLCSYNVFLLHEAISTLGIKHHESEMNRLALDKYFDQEYQHYMDRKLKTYWENHGNDAMTMLHKLEGMISNINDVEVNKKIQDSLKLIECSNAECEHKREEIMKKLNDSREYQVTQTLTNALKALMKRAISNKESDVNFLSLPKMVTYMRTIENPTLQELIIILLVSYYNTPLELVFGDIPQKNIIIRQHAEQIDEWFNNCKYNYLRQKYGNILDNYLDLSKIPFIFENYIVPNEILQKITIPTNPKEAIHIPEDISELILQYQIETFEQCEQLQRLERNPFSDDGFTDDLRDHKPAPIKTIQKTQDNSKMDPPPQIDGIGRSQHDQIDTKEKTQDNSDANPSQQPKEVGDSQHGRANPEQKKQDNSDANHTHQTEGVSDSQHDQINPEQKKQDNSDANPSQQPKEVGDSQHGQTNP